MQLGFYSLLELFILTSDIDILNTAFVKYLKGLSVNERALHLLECAISGGEMFYELAERLGTYDPRELAERVEVSGG